MTSHESGKTGTEPGLSSERPGRLDLSPGLQVWKRRLELVMALPAHNRAQRRKKRKALALLGRRMKRAKVAVEIS